MITPFALGLLASGTALAARPLCVSSRTIGAGMLVAGALLMASPALLLLDEPLSALDLGLRERVLPYLERIQDKLAIPMLYASHAEVEIRALADWVMVLDGGRVVRSG